ncbi:gamma-glutamyltransferase [Staphylococcus aureus]
MSSKDHTQSSKQGLIFVSHPLAAKVGQRILDQGGTALDAVIAIQLTLNVVEPFASGLGGGGYLLYYDNDSGQITSFDARETAPSHINKQFYLDDKGNYKPFFDLSTHGSIVAVPGIPKLFEYLYDHYCTLNLDDLINPSIELAENGHRANWATEKYSQHQIARIQKFKETRQVYTNQDGSYFHEGDWIQLPQLARTLKILRSHGFGAFYHGDIAKQLVSVVQQYGGTITEEDLRDYDIRIKPSVSAKYRDYTIHSIGPSSSGGITVIQILKILESFDVSSMGTQSVDYMHYLIQAMQIAYSDRANYIADDDYYHVPVSALIDEAYLKQRSHLIDEHVATFNIQHGNIPLGPNVESHTDIDETHTETTHFSVTDQYGNVASFTTSIGMIYGSGITVPKYGFLLNTTIDGFDVVPGGINEIEPSKRPLSNMSPTIITKDKKPYLEVGAPGAISIIASVVQTIINVLDFGMSIQEAINAPRIYTSNASRIEWEPQFDQALILKLIAKGHAFEYQPEPYIGDVHGLQFVKHGAIGGADNTREGTVSGGSIKIIQDREKDVTSTARSSYTIELNHVTLPLYEDQIVKHDNQFWLRHDIVLLLFEHGKFALDKIECFVEDGDRYMNLMQIATTLDYQTTTLKNGIHLYKEIQPRITDSQASYYRYDKESITR